MDNFTVFLSIVRAINAGLYRRYALCGRLVVDSLLPDQICAEGHGPHMGENVNSLDSRMRDKCTSYLIRLGLQTRLGELNLKLRAKASYKPLNHTADAPGPLMIMLV